MYARLLEHNTSIIHEIDDKLFLNFIEQYRVSSTSNSELLILS